MGIQGLLPFVKEATQPVNMRKYNGYAVAVDTYCWLHKGAFACSLQLAKGEPTDMYVRYCLKYVNMLRSMGVRPVMVFDGCTLPAKKHVEKSRRERRELYNKKGRQFLREGKVSEARDCFNKCVNVTPQMALEVMKAVRSLGVDCIVAPYEADAQLTYLHKVGIVQAVITEDSDLVAFGCKRVIVKLDLNGNGLEIESSKLHESMKIGAKFTPEKFRYMCIISGCDYLPSLPGIGLKKARKLFQLVTNPDMSQVLKRMPGTLKLKQSVPAEYIEGFHKANNTFLHQLAFDPRRRKLVPLSPYPDDVDPKDLEYAGKYLNDQQAYHIALGNMDINSMQMIFDFTPERTKSYDRTLPRHKLSIWHKDYRPGPDMTDENLKEVERQGTQGKEVTVKIKMCKRQREEDLPDELPTDNDLASMYGTPAAKRRPMQPPPAVIPETPSPCKTKSAQQVVADKLLEKAKSPKRSPVRRFNRFAVKGRRSERRALHMEDKVASRFFGPPPEETETKEMSMSQENHNLQDGICKMETSDDEEGSNDEVVVKSEWAWGKAEPAPRNTTLSVLDKLQQFQRNNSAPVLVSKIKEERVQSRGLSEKMNNGINMDINVKQEDVSEMKEENGNTGAVIVKQEDELAETKESNSPLSSQSGRSTPKARGAFSWGSSKSKKSNKAKTTGVLSLDMFRRTSSSGNGTKMNWKREKSSEDDKQPSSQGDVEESMVSKHKTDQYSQNSDTSYKFSQDVDVDSQESASQISFSAKMSQTSNLYSLDADALSYSQLGISRNNSLLNSQDTSESQSLDLPDQDSSEDLPEAIQSQDSPELSHSKVTSEPKQEQDLPKLPFIEGIDVDDPILDNPKDVRPTKSHNLFSNTKSSKSINFYSAVETKPDKSVVVSSREDNKRKKGINVDDPSLDNHKDVCPAKSHILFSNTKSSKSINFKSAVETKPDKSVVVSSRKYTKRKDAVVDSISSYFSDRRRSSDESEDVSQDEVEETSDSVNSEEENKNVECIDLTDVEGKDSVSDSNQKQQRQTVKSTQNSSLKKTPATSRLQGACKPSGLSKKRKKPNSSKKTDENAPRQTTLFSFLKKSQPKNELEKKPHTSDGPMSPVKTNIINDDTPEGDNSLLKKDIKKVQRVIFT